MTDTGPGPRLARRATPVAPGTYADLARTIRSAGLMTARPGWYAVLTAVLVLTLGGVVAAMVAWKGSWWLLTLAPVVAVIGTQTGFLGHDIGHRQVARRARTRSVLGVLAGNLLSGLSYSWWVEKHDAHHEHPNDLEHDPDVRPGAFVWSAEQAARRRGVASWWTRHQASLFVPLLFLEALNLHLSSVLALLRPGPARLRTTELTLLGVHAVGYVTLLVATLDGWQILAFATIHKGLQGLYLGLSFAPNHKGMPSLSAEQAADPLRLQVLTSRTIPGGPVLGHVLGGLNYQIEHHLFPSMPRPHLRRAQPLVRAFCLRHGISYQECSARASYGAAFAHLSRVASAAAPPPPR